MRIIWTTTENETKAYGAQEAGEPACAVNLPSQSQSNVKQDVSVGSLLSYLQHTRAEDYGCTATEGNIFTARAVRRQVAI